MAAIVSRVWMLAVVAVLAGSIAAPSSASESDCATIDDRRARLRCTDEYAIALGSRAKVAVRKLLRNPDSAVFSLLRQVPGKNGDALCGRVDVESPDGRMTGAQDFAFDDGTAYVLLKNVRRDGATDTPNAERLTRLGRDIEAFIAICGPGLPTMAR